MPYGVWHRPRNSFSSQHPKYINRLWYFFFQISILSYCNSCLAVALVVVVVSSWWRGAEDDGRTWEGRRRWLFQMNGTSVRLLLLAVMVATRESFLYVDDGHHFEFSQPYRALFFSRWICVIFLETFDIVDELWRVSLAIGNVGDFLRRILRRLNPISGPLNT